MNVFYPGFGSKKDTNSEPLKLFGRVEPNKTGVLIAGTDDVPP